VHDDGYFDESVAARYDETASERFQRDEVDATVDLLVELAAGGRALEFAIGTGRIGLPLAARGVEVAGIEMSEAMAARLRTKPGGDAISVTIGDMASTTVEGTVDAELVDVTIGDMATTRVEGTFRLVYLVYNTIGNLTTQDAQVACFRNAAAHLAPGGCFLIEIGVPGLRTLPPGERYQVFYGSDDYWGIDEYDVANQGLISHHVENVDGEYRRVSMPFRYAWPAEFDLMARLAGMTRRDRWAGWKHEPFTSESEVHVSVWEKPAP
jgi:SAM-dependent methyltransferase